MTGMHETTSTHVPEAGGPRPLRPGGSGSCRVPDGRAVPTASPRASSPQASSPQASLRTASPSSSASLTVTVVQPEERAPLGRLGEWLRAQGAGLRTVRLWRGQEVPAVEQVDDALVVLGGAMSAHDDDTCPWLADLRRLLRHAARSDLPTVAVCLGAQVAAEALGGQTAVPSPYGREGGVVDLHLTPAAREDPLLGPAAEAAAREAADLGLPVWHDRCLPAIVSHDDAVVRLPDDAVLLASSAQCPLQAWRVGGLLALQHHPESSPQRVGYWQARSVLRSQGVAGATTMTQEDMPSWAVAAGERAQHQAQEADPVIRAFGRALAVSLVGQAEEARGYARSSTSTTS